MSSDDSVLVYVRRAKDPNDFLVVCCNFTPVPRDAYRVGVPMPGWYQEVFNSDSEFYGGSNVGNFPGRQSEKVTAQARENSIVVRMPPLGVTVFKPMNRFA